MDKFKNKYRVSSARLKNWDYRKNGAYFITICTHTRKYHFGKIMERVDLKESLMQLNEIGQMAENFWMEIPKHFPFVELGNFVIMPNHTHGILIIDITKIADDGNGDGGGGYMVETVQCNVSTENAKYK
jgi:putative transposase